MSATTIHVNVDSEIEAQAKDALASLGLNMTDAFNIFLRQTIQQRSIPLGESDESPQKPLKLGCMKGKMWMADDFDAPMKLIKTISPEKKTLTPGCMKGKMWMADDFDAPMEEFEEYM